MPNAYVFADEAGCFVFKRRKPDRKDGPSDYFILTTVTAPEWGISDDLLRVRRALALKGEADRNKLHCTTDLQEVRNEVFAIIAKQPFRLDSTIMKKSKAQAQTKISEERFYQTAWYFHIKHLAGAVRLTRTILRLAGLGL